MSNDDSTDSLKAAGNFAFSSGRHSDALSLYTRALDFFDAGKGGSTSSVDLLARAVLLSNRAAAALARGGPGDALAALTDASAALRAAPTYGKAHGRRAAALSSLGQLDEAVVAFNAGLRAEPSSVALRSGLEAVIAAQAAGRKRDHEARAATATATATAPIFSAVPSTPPEPTAEDLFASFLSDVSTLQAVTSAAAAEREARHAPISEAAGAIKRVEADVATALMGGGGGGLVTWSPP